MKLQTLFMSALITLAAPTLCAQPNVLGITAERDGALPTMAQLTPGNEAWRYARNVVGVRFDEKGQLQYTLPDQAAQAPTLPRQKGTPSADGLWTALNQGDRLWVETLTGTDVCRQQVSDPTADSDGPVEGHSPIVWGQSVHRHEFGIDGGLFWSPQGHRLAFYRMDQSMVGQYPLLQTSVREAEVRWVRYPMAGDTSHQVTIGIYNPDTQQTVWLKTNQKPHSGQGINAPDHYLTNVAWRPDGKQIFVAEVNRLQNFMELNAYDAETGGFVETLFTERSDRYVEPQHPMYFLPGSNDKFVWLSARDCFLHMYLYDLSQQNQASQHGALMTLDLHPASLEGRQLTRGDWSVTQLLGADPKVRRLYFMATEASPMESHLYCVDLKSLKVDRLTAEPGVHRVVCNADYSQFYDTYTNHDTPRVSQLVTLRGARVTARKELYRAADPMSDLALPEVECGTLTAADGQTPLYYRLVKPMGYATARDTLADGTTVSRRFPVVVYLYNGPHAQLVTEGLRYGLPGWDHYMATRGYVVFTIDGRGSANRGLAFEQAIWRDLGHHEGEDQMQGVAYLKSLPYVDADRIGIYGWSYGGFMTTYMMLHYPETFKVGVCGGPVLDWSRYEVMYGERYMGTPQNNPEGYAANTLINKADRLKGHLLIIHDDQDDTVVPQISMQFLKAAVAAGTYPDYMLYMDYPHNVRGKDRVHLLNNITRYFDEHLK